MEHGRLDEAAFRDFTFANPVRFYTAGTRASSRVRVSRTPPPLSLRRRPSEAARGTGRDRHRREPRDRQGLRLELGAAGATVYVTGRTEQEGAAPLPGTIAATAADVDAAGGRGIAVRCDHRDDEQVAALFARVRGEEPGGSTCSSTTRS